MEHIHSIKHINCCVLDHYTYCLKWKRTNDKTDRYEEESKRYNHIMKVYKEYQLGNKNMKEKLAHLVLAFPRRCHENVNVVAEEKHSQRVRTVCIISIETFTGLVTEKQSCIASIKCYTHPFEQLLKMSQKSRKHCSHLSSGALTV